VNYFYVEVDIMSKSDLQIAIEASINLVKDMGYPLAKVIDVKRGDKSYETEYYVTIFTGKLDKLFFIIRTWGNYIVDIKRYTPKK